jgi:hypothetical protein
MTAGPGAVEAPGPPIPPDAESPQAAQLERSSCVVVSDGRSGAVLPLR